MTKSRNYKIAQQGLFLGEAMAARSARGLTEKLCWETLAACGTKQKATLMFKSLKEPAHSYKQNLFTACHTKYNLLNSYSSLLKLSHPNQVQWNLDLTKCQGTGEICSSYRGFVISKTSIERIFGKTSKMLVISRYHLLYLEIKISNAQHLRI